MQHEQIHYHLFYSYYLCIAATCFGVISRRLQGADIKVSMKLTAIK
jgi:hypothetical protein